jgi:hypothetical protein
MLFDIEKGRGGEEYQRNMGVAFIALKGLRLVRYLSSNLIDMLLEKGIIAISFLFYY